MISLELKKRKFHFITIPNSKHLFQKTKFLINFLQKNQSDLCIIDMREYGEKISKTLFTKNFRTALFDDAWCKKIYSDIVFNGTNVKEFQNYKTINKKSKIFMGTKYWILDKNFQKFAKKTKSIKQKKSFTIIISIGGSDVFNLTTTILKSIISIEKIKIFIIIGPFFTHHKKLRNIIKSNPHITLNSSPTKIWKLFSKADVAISNGGNTLFELSCMGIPTLCIPTMKHEIKYVQVFSSQNFSYGLKLRERNLFAIQSSLLKILNDTKLQKQMCSSGKKIVDGQGLSRVTKIILGYL
jgi:spore coat polysaccharide biosynthesis predicted glycosyltransferase SpsG